jgi:hypothetical protein
VSGWAIKESLSGYAGTLAYVFAYLLSVIREKSTLRLYAESIPLYLPETGDYKRGA